jgi:hypothetical protein
LDIRRHIGVWRRLLQLFQWPPGTDVNSCEDVLSPRWLWLAVPFVLAILLAGMLPPLDFDVREYHLQSPKEFFQQGQITFLPHNVYANMALGTEMLSLLAMVVGGQDRDRRLYPAYRLGVAGGWPAAVHTGRRRRCRVGLYLGSVDRQHRIGRVCRGRFGVLSVSGRVRIIAAARRAGQRGATRGWYTSWGGS